MPALTRYTGRVARRYGRRSRIGRAYGVASHVYRNRKRYKRAFSMAGRLAKRAKHVRFSAKNIGFTPGSSSSQVHRTTDTGGVNEASRTLYQHGLLDIPQGTDVGSRQRELAYVSGVRICGEIRNTHAGPLYVNVAVLSPRAGASSIETSDFFRAQGANNNQSNRAVNFSVALTSLDFKCLPINTDRYVVLKHKRMRLNEVDNSASASFDSNSGRNYMNIDWWIPLKRQFRWQSAQALNPESGACFLVYWYDKWGSNGGAAASTCARVSWNTKAYFKDPVNQFKY